MPYHFEKGPPWSVVESIANESKDSLYRELEILRDTTQEMTVSRAYTSSNLNVGPTNTTEKRVAHMQTHWFGKTPGDGGSWRPQARTRPPATTDTVLMAPKGSSLWTSYENLIANWPAFYPNDPPPRLMESTGWWINFHGDVEHVLREALTRAAEISLGLKNGETLAKPSAARRHWAVTVDMICPSPWFEVWIEWEGDDTKKDSDGHVAVTVLTPSHPRGNVLTRPAGGRMRLPDAEAEPPEPGGDQGTWVVAEDRHVYYHSPPSSVALPQNVWMFPQLGPAVDGRNRVRVIRPAEADGGVLKAGRPWTP